MVINPSKPYRILEQPHSQRRHWKIICVGAGASGLYLAYRAEQRMQDYELIIYEKNPEVGGTWLENTYPGCACDIPAHLYTYSFRPNPNYTKYFAGSDEIQKYFTDFKDEYNLGRFIKYNTKVTKAHWDDSKGIYNVEVTHADGSTEWDWCNTLINCSGVLNEWKWPDIPGLNSFKGKLLHSARWDHSVDYAGKSVGLIGAGSSGIQITPQIQKAASSLDVFIRSPVWITPQLGGASRAEDCAIDNPIIADLLVRGSQPYTFSDEEQRMLREDPALLLDLRRAMEISVCSAQEYFKYGSEKQEAVFQFVTEQMRIALGDNEELKEKLIPKFPVGCRRATPGAGYLEAITAKNTKVHFDAIAEVTPNGIRTKSGEEREFEILVCATGFQVGFCPFFEIKGKDGRVMQEEWNPNPNCYIGIAAPGYPNYFSSLGPRGPWGNGSVLFPIEVNLDYFISLMQRMQKEGIKSMMPSQKATDDFAIHCDEWHSDSVWNQPCMSWYKREGPNSRPYLYCGTTPSYMKTLSTIRYEDYEYEYVHENRFAYLGNGRIAAEFLPKEEKPSKMVSYLRLADTPWEIV